MISEDVQRRVDAYRGNPGALAQRYQMTQELLDLLALQKLKSEKEAAARSMALAMQQQGEPPTVAQQREQQVAQMSKQELAQQLGGIGQLAQQQQRPPMMSGVATAPGSENVMTEQAMAAGGIVAFQRGGEMPQETYAERQDRQKREKGSIYSPYYGLSLGDLQDIVAQEIIDAQQAAGEAQAARAAVTRERAQAAARRASADRGTFAPEGRERTLGQAARALGEDISSGIRSVLPEAPVVSRLQMGSQNEAFVPIVTRTEPGTSAPEEGTVVAERGMPTEVERVAAPAEPRRPAIEELMGEASRRSQRQGLPSIAAAPQQAMTPEQMGALLSAGRAPQGTQAQQDMFETLRRYQKDVEGMQYPRMSEEARRGREEAIRRQEERLGREFDPERQRLAFLRDFLLGGAGRTGIGSVFAGAGGAGARSMAAAEAAQREREDKIESMREALRGKTEEEARQEFSAKLKTREMAMGAEKALLDLSVKMAEGDKDRGTKLAIVAQELATKADLTREELRTRIQLEAQKLGVTLDIADADRLVKMAQVYATREEAAARMRQAEAQQASTEEARREGRVATNVRSRIDDLARIDRDFADMRKNNPMLDQLLTKYEAGEALKPEQAAKVNSYLRAKQERINQVNQAYRSIGVGAGPNVGAVGGTNLVDLAKAELARRESAK